MGDIDLFLDEQESRFGPIALRVAAGDAVRYDRRREHGVIGVASAGKWVAAAVVLRLADAGVLSLATTVRDVLGRGSTLTLDQLMSHTSGLVPEHPSVGDEGVTIADAAAAILAEPPAHEPSTVFEYGNASMQVAAHLVEVVTNRRWVDLVREIGQFAYEGSPANPHVGGGLRCDLEALDGFVRELETGDLLSARAIVEMERDRTVRLRKQATPAPLRWGYGIGCWIEDVDEDGETTRTVSPGASGCHPWIDRSLANPHRGVLFMDHDPDDFRSANRLYLRLRAMVSP